MKNTTLLENASNRAKHDSSPTVRAFTGGSRRVAFTIYGLGMSVAFLSLSFVGPGFSPFEVIRGLFEDPVPAVVHDWWDLRLQRLLFAAAIGGALSLAGVAFQAVLRNPLAEPYILGISSGASVGVLSSAWWWAGSALAVPAFTGGIAALLLFMAAVKWAKARDSGTLILTGAVLNAIFGALILLFYSFLSGSAIAGGSRVELGLHWVMGNLGPEQYLGKTWVRDMWIVLTIGLVTLLLSARSLDLLVLGDEEAADLGVRPEPLRWLILVGASLVTAAVVAAAGPIGFVGLIVPHSVRRLHGSSHRRVLPFAVLAGALFLMIADTLARVAIGGRVLPVGVVTALLGGPFFLARLRRRRGETS